MCASLCVGVSVCVCVCVPVDLLDWALVNPLVPRVQKIKIRYLNCKVPSISLTSKKTCLSSGTNGQSWTKHSHEIVGIFPPPKKMVKYQAWYQAQPGTFLKNPEHFLKIRNIFTMVAFKSKGLIRKPKSVSELDRQSAVWRSFSLGRLTHYSRGRAGRLRYFLHFFNNKKIIFFAFFIVNLTWGWAGAEVGYSE